MDKLTSTVKRNASHSISSTILPADQKTRQKDSSNSEDAFFEAYKLALPQKMIFSYLSYSNTMNSTIQKCDLRFLPLLFLAMKNQ